MHTTHLARVEASGMMYVLLMTSDVTMAIIRIEQSVPYDTKLE